MPGVNSGTGGVRSARFSFPNPMTCLSRVQEEYMHEITDVIVSQGVGVFHGPRDGRSRLGGGGTSMQNDLTPSFEG